MPVYFETVNEDFGRCPEDGVVVEALPYLQRIAALEKA